MRLLITTDGSPHSEVTVRLGAEIARHSKQAPTILTVIKDRADRPQARLVLARAREWPKPLVPEAQTRMRVGHPAEEIICEVEEGGYDLVVVGQREHHTLFTRFFLGSTAQRVVEHAPCPVIIAKGQVGPIRRILLCDSGAASSSLLGFIKFLPVSCPGSRRSHLGGKRGR